MIVIEQPIHLGHRAYLLMASRRTTLGTAVILIAVVALLLRGGLSGLVAGAMMSMGLSGQDALALAGTYTNIACVALFILGLLMTAMGFAAARIEYTNYTFTLEQFTMRLRRGIITTNEVSIPYRQMQDINISRGIIHRMAGTARMVIDSAGQEEPGEHNQTDIVFDPIDNDLAQELRTTLQRRIGVQVVEGEGQSDRETAELRRMAEVSRQPE